MMSQASELIEQLSLLEEKLIFYHGTTSNFLREILKKGFTPNPKKKIWNQESGGLESYLGTYFSRNWFTAYAAAGDATRKLGGSRIVFEVQLETRTGLADEDEIPKIQGPLNVVRQVRVDVDHAASIVHSFDKQSIPSDHWIVPKNFMKEVGIPVARKWIEEFQERRKVKLSRQEQKKLIRPLIEYLKQVLYMMIETKMDDPETFNQSNAEFRKAKDSVITALGPKMFRAGMSDGFGTANIRILQPVTFKGANRVIAAVEIQEEKYTDPNDLDKEGKPRIKLMDILIPRYGKISDDFLRVYKERVGGKFEVRKS
jgi:hypothetical protein